MFLSDYQYHAMMRDPAFCNLFPFFFFFSPFPVFFMDGGCCLLLETRFPICYVSFFGTIRGGV